MDCPDAETLLAVVEGRFAGDRTSTDGHIGDCATCRTRLNELAQSSGRDGEPRQGMRVGRYVLRQRLGQGGMGVVFCADDVVLDRTVAIKFVAPLLLVDESARARFQREAQTTASLDHPHIGAVYEVGDYRGRPYLVMAYHDGETLRQRLDRGPLSAAEAIRVLGELAEALAAAHGSGVIHRDVKPSNVILTAGGLKVVDFGVAKWMTRDETLTRTGELVGTLAYMAPEQLRGDTADARADVWSFGVVGYQAVTGALPFVGDTPHALLAAVIDQRPRQPRRSHPQVPADLEIILLNCLETEAARRYPSAKELAEDLRRLVAHEPIVARRATWAYRLGRAVRRRRAHVAVVGLATIAAVSVVATVSQSRHQRALLCSGARTTGVWDDARRAELRRVFTTHKSPSVRYALEVVTRDLDAWSAAWMRGRREACEATRVRGEQSEALLDLRMQCFDARLDEARSTVDALTRGEPDVVAVAARLTASIGSPSSCEAPRLAAVTHLPIDPQARAHIDELEKLVADTRVLMYAERWKEGAQLALRIVDGARRAAYAPLLARAYILQSRFALELELHDEARLAALDAMVAAENGHDEFQIGRAAIGLAQVCNETKQYVEAHRLLDLAEAAARRIGRADPDFEFARLLALELTFYRENNFEAALQTLDRACGFAEQSGNELQVAACSVNKFYTLSMLGRAAQALDADRRALAIEERRFGGDSPNVPDRLAEIASQELALDRNQEALVDAQRALSLRERAATPNERDVSNSLTLVGQILSALGRDADARAQLKQGLIVSEHALGATDPDLTYPLQELAELEAKTGHLDTARSLLDRAIAINTGAGNQPAVAELLAHVAAIEITRKRASVALAKLTAAQAILASHPVRPDVSARVEFLRGSVRWELGDHLAGLELVQNAHKMLARSDASALSKRIDAWLALVGS